MDGLVDGTLVDGLLEVGLVVGRVVVDGFAVGLNVDDGFAVGLKVDDGFAVGLKVDDGFAVGLDVDDGFAVGAMLVGRLDDGLCEGRYVGLLVVIFDVGAADGMGWVESLFTHLYTAVEFD